MKNGELDRQSSCQHDSDRMEPYDVTIKSHSMQKVYVKLVIWELKSLDIICIKYIPIFEQMN